jgi:hypothetical protein
MKVYPQMGFREDLLLMDISIAAPAEIRKRHRIDHEVRSRKWRSATSYVNNRRLTRDACDQSPGVFDVHLSSWGGAARVNVWRDLDESETRL